MYKRIFNTYDRSRKAFKVEETRPTTPPNRRPLYTNGLLDGLPHICRNKFVHLSSRLNVICPEEPVGVQSHGLAIPTYIPFLVWVVFSAVTEIIQALREAISCSIVHQVGQEPEGIVIDDLRRAGIHGRQGRLELVVGLLDDLTPGGNTISIAATEVGFGDRCQVLWVDVRDDNILYAGIDELLYIRGCDGSELISKIGVLGISKPVCVGMLGKIILSSPDERERLSCSTCARAGIVGDLFFDRRRTSIGSCVSRVDGCSEFPSSTAATKGVVDKRHMEEIGEEADSNRSIGPCTVAVDSSRVSSHPMSIAAVAIVTELITECD